MAWPFYSIVFGIGMGVIGFLLLRPRQLTYGQQHGQHRPYTFPDQEHGNRTNGTHEERIHQKARRVLYA